MAPRAVSYFIRCMNRFVSHDNVVSVIRIRGQEKNLWGFKRGGKISNIFFRGNRDVRWKQIRGTSGYLVWYKTIINGYGIEIQIWTTTINWKVFLKQS